MSRLPTSHHRRDLKYVRNVCGYWFRREDDAFIWRDGLGLARYGLAEVVIFSLLFGSIGGAFAVAALLYHWAAWIGAGAVGLFWLEIIYFFRDPERAIPNDPNVLVSPADGTITNIEEVADAELGSLMLDIRHGQETIEELKSRGFNVSMLKAAWGRPVAVRIGPGIIEAAGDPTAKRNAAAY